uniref:Uncharacterized protein n=1 Tax=Micrurus lemniscatus lemniscatus TaxID=129467 RepID=A0A2D4H7C3_MICLE
MIWKTERFHRHLNSKQPKSKNYQGGWGWNPLTNTGRASRLYTNREQTPLPSGTDDVTYLGNETSASQPPSKLREHHSSLLSYILFYWLHAVQRPLSVLCICLLSPYFAIPQGANPILALPSP